MSAQMTPDQAKFLLALTLPTIKTEHETTKRVIEAIPLDKGDYRPEPVAKLGGSLQARGCRLNRQCSHSIEGGLALPSSRSMAPPQAAVELARASYVGREC